jgi:hypothetical protein
MAIQVKAFGPLLLEFKSRGGPQRIPDGIHEQEGSI